MDSEKIKERNYKHYISKNGDKMGLMIYCDVSKENPYYIRILKGETNEFPHGIPIGRFCETKEIAFSERKKIAEYLELKESIT